jgi:hypothetical protein
MPATITTLRGTLKTALTNAGVWDVYSYPLPTPTANSITIAPDEPYIRVQSNQKLAIAPVVRFKLLLAVPLFDNQGNLTQIEDYIVALMAKMAAATTLTIHVGDFSAPGILETPSGNLLQTELPIEIITGWS